jgi:hypothetical protein
MKKVLFVIVLFIVLFACEKESCFECIKTEYSKYQFAGSTNTYIIESVTVLNKVCDVTDISALYQIQEEVTTDFITRNDGARNYEYRYEILWKPVN